MKHVGTKMLEDRRVVKFCTPSTSKDETYLAHTVSVSLPVWIYCMRIMRCTQVEKNISVPGMRTPRAALLPPARSVQLTSVTSFPWVVGQGHIQTRDLRAFALDSQLERTLSQCVVPDSSDAQILASCTVNRSQLGFTVLETMSSVQLIPALHMHTWCPDWKAAQVLQSWWVQIILQVAKS